jgi:hypothetical protein
VYKELIVKEADSLVITHLLHAQMGVELLFQEMQRRPLQAGREVWRCQHYARRRYLANMQRTFTDLLYLHIGKPVDIIK